jgi:hypothetical protein
MLNATLAASVNDTDVTARDQLELGSTAVAGMSIAAGPRCKFGCRRGNCNWPIIAEREENKEGAQELKRALGRVAMTLFVANCIGGLSGCGGSGQAAAVGVPAGPVPPAPGPAPPPPAPPSPPPYSATVSWSTPLLNTDGTSLTDVSGFRIHYGTNPTSLTQMVTVSGAGITSHVISGLSAGTYYFAVSTLNSTGTASDPSNAASKTVP